MQIQEIPLKEIELHSPPCLFSFPRVTAELMTSLQENGIITPPLLFRERTRPRWLILSGHRRLFCLKALGVEKVWGNLLEENISLEAAFIRGVDDNWIGRKLNGLEICHILSRLHQDFGWSAERIGSAFFPRFKLPRRVEFIELADQLSALADSVKTVILELFENITELIHLKDMGPSDLTAVLTLLKKYPYSFSKRLELITFLKDIAVREGQSIRHIIAEISQERSEKETQPVSCRGEQLRKIIMARRFPKWTLALNQALGRLKSQTQPLNLDLTIDPTLEKEEIFGPLRFSSPGALQAISERLKTLSLNPELDNIFQLLKCGRE